MSSQLLDSKSKYHILKNQLGGEWERSHLMSNYNIFEDNMGISVDYKHMNDDNNMGDNLHIVVICEEPAIRFHFDIFNIAGTYDYNITFANDYRGIDDYRALPEIKNKLSVAIIKIMQVIPADRRSRISEKIAEVRQVLDTLNTFDAEIFILRHLA